MVLRFSAFVVFLISSIAIALGEPVDFAHEVVPVLKKHCADCHLGEKRKGGFSMNTRALLLEGSENGEVLHVGKAMESYLVELVESDDDEVWMPPKGDRLSKTETAVLKRWIDEGLKWEEGFTFGEPAWEPPLGPRVVDLPAAVDGRENEVDRILDAYLAKRKIARPERAPDEVFMRRLSLDLTGLLPEIQELEAFVADTSPDKREKLIAATLGKEAAYAEHWLTFWNDLLRNDYAGTGYIDGGRTQITGWLYRSLIENKPFDEFVRELIAPEPEAAGFIEGIQWRGNVNASQTRAVQFAQNISQVFIGINMKCASCHDSFIDDWKLEEAYGLAGIYATEPVEIHRCDKPTGVMAKAAWIFPELGQVDAEAEQPERLKQLAALMTDAGNGRFSRTIVNRIWHRLMGRGIVHPVDAMHAKPWSEDLLDYLAVHFAENGYDLKETMRLIVSSEAYQAKAQVVEGEPEPGEYVYRGPLAKRMSAEQFVDAVWRLTGSSPARPSAQVMRMVVREGEYDDVPVTGQWIWAKSEDGGLPPSGESVTLRKVFDLPQKPVRADGVITCDNAYVIYVNGRKMGEDNNWTTVETVALEDVLKSGRNEILIVGTNAGREPSRAAVFFEAKIRVTAPPAGTSEVITVATDDSWESTKRQPDRRGTFGAKPVKDWKPVAVEDGGMWEKRVSDQIRASLASAASEKPKLVRASLVKSDLLMRSLGRPNREQVVTVRPEELSTLQAIDLANGDILAKALESGAQRLVASSGRSVSDMGEKLWSTALSRKPTASERAVMVEITGAEISQQGVEDLLWTVLMLPEFQLIR